MSGGQHAVRVDQAAAAKPSAVIAKSYCQHRHERILAVGHRRTAHYLGFDVSPVCRLDQLVLEGRVGTMLQRYLMSASFLIFRPRGRKIPWHQRQQRD
jgi:hypothetical protein